MRPSGPPQVGRSVAIGLFEGEAQARAAAAAVREHGTPEHEIGMLLPPAEPSGLLATATHDRGLEELLVELGVPDGEARFYAQAVQAGRSMVAVRTAHDYAATRELLRQHGASDVQSQGAELVRGDGGGVSGGTGPKPIDITGRWEDVRSRFEMLFGQHYGSTDATWADLEPVYAWAWEQANQPAFRGRPWSEVASAVESEWTSARPDLAWSDVSGPVRDVFEDVADEAASAEGGAQRRIPRQGVDQWGPARDVR